MPQHNRNQPITECQKCGICCEKGGPAFHLEDKPLIEKGIIPSKYLFTIRKGEPAHENIRGGYIRVPTDIIKIKGKGDNWRCIFLDEKRRHCNIYEDRPLECRMLKCWDTEAIEQIYLKNMLTRKDLLYGIQGLWNLVEDHQKRCEYGLIEELLNSFKENDHDQKETEEKILEIIRYDAHLRELMVEKGSMDKGILDFLFGSPLLKTLPRFGFHVQQDGKVWRLRMKT